MILLQDPFRRDLLLQQVPRHGFAFGDNLSLALPAGGHEDRMLSRFFCLRPFELQRGVHTAFEQRRQRPVLLHAAAEDDDIVTVGVGDIFCRQERAGDRRKKHAFKIADNIDEDIVKEFSVRDFPDVEDRGHARPDGQDRSQNPENRENNPEGISRAAAFMADQPDITEEQQR